MKKLLSVMLLTAMILAMITAFTACRADIPEDDADTEEDSDRDDTKKDDADKEDKIPDGYKLFKNDDICFAYPENWTKSDSSIVILADGASNKQNITLAYEQVSDIYKNMTAESFVTAFQPYYSQMGITISNAIVVNVKNSNGLDITKISFNSTTAGVTMTQTMYITAVGDKNYIVTVTEVEQNVKLLQTVFDTLDKVD